MTDTIIVACHMQLEPVQRLEFGLPHFFMKQTLKLNETGTWELKSSMVAQSRICDHAKVKLYALIRKKIYIIRE